MQTGKNAMASAKETASNIGASAKAGMDKTKATVEEKVEKMASQHPADKVMAERKKQDKIQEAEIAKREAREYNAAAREQARGPVTAAYPSAAAYDDPTGGCVSGGTVESHPDGTQTWASRSATAYSPYAGSGDPAGHGTGGGPA